MDYFTSVLAVSLLLLPNIASTDEVFINVSEPVLQAGDTLNITCAVPNFLMGDLLYITKHVAEGQDFWFSTNGMLIGDDFPGRERYSSRNTGAAKEYYFYLGIRDVQPEDAGIYTCSLHSRGYKEEANSSVTVLVQPTVEIAVSTKLKTIPVSETSSGIIFEKKEIVQITCLVNNSVPEPNVTIRLEKEDVTEDFAYNSSNVTVALGGLQAFSATYYSVWLTKKMTVRQKLASKMLSCEARIHPALPPVRRNFTIQIRGYDSGSPKMAPLSSMLLAVITTLSLRRLTHL